MVGCKPRFTLQGGARGIFVICNLQNDFLLKREHSFYPYKVQQREA